MAGTEVAFHRLLVKLSGEALHGRGEPTESIRNASLRSPACFTPVAERGVETAVVIGAGNIYRGMAAAAEGMDRATADYAGMLATDAQLPRGAGRAREARRASRA